MNPRLAVLMTVYNGGEHLAPAIKSLLCQSYSDFDLHIIDDGSTDGSAQILSSFRDQDPRVRVHSKTNTGIVDSLALGLSNINSEYLARADADDLSSPDRFLTQVAFLDANKNVLAVSGKGRQIDWAGNDLGTFTRTGDPGQADATAVPAREPYLMQPFLMLRTSALHEVGGYRPFPVSEDTDLFWRLQRRGQLVSLDLEMGSYRLNPHSVSSRSVTMGRLMSGCSQLAAVSAKRVKENRADVLINLEVASLLKASTSSLEALACAVDEDLIPDERRWFRAAIGVKLLEMAGYRPYEVEASDTAFIGGALRAQWPHISRQNRQLIRRMCSGSAARLLVANRLTTARPLLRFADPFLTALRWAARLLVSPGSYRRLRKHLTGGGDLEISK